MSPAVAAHASDRDRLRRPSYARACTLGAVAHRSQNGNAKPKQKRKRKRGRWGRRPQVGARPGELVIPVAEPGSSVTVHTFDYGPERCHEWDPSVAQVGPPSPELHAEGIAVRWIDINGLSDRSLLEQLATAFQIHPLALADIVNVPQRAKVDAYEQNHLIIVRMARVLDGESHEYEQLSIVVGDHWLLTVQEQAGDCFDPIRTRLRQKLGNVRTMGSDYLAYVLLDAVVDAYFPVAEQIGVAFEELERELIEHGGSRSHLERIHALRSELREFERPVRQMQALLSTLLQGAQSPISEPVRVWLRDVHDHAIQVGEQLDGLRDFATALMELYLSTANNKMNEVMKVLTVTTSIFIPLTFIASIYGMNFEYMPETKQWWGYPGVLLLMLVLGIGLFQMFKRRDWL
jgi:magnesium transporter